METIKKIVLQFPDGETMGVMKYADEHPEVRFHNTEVYQNSVSGERYILMVSDYQPTSTDVMAEETGTIIWYDLPNGWQRECLCVGVWVCRKNGRYIIITT